ncbi:MAG: hypothetical protein HYS06_02365 [Methylocystis sp.]|nr:hypothetical protein [Methylocystis sp.]MBI3275140.1 hypothetical protein [Methylocystis sp.]
MSKLKIVALILLVGALISGPAEAFCLFGCKPTTADARRVFENLLKAKFSAPFNIVSFEETRFWEIDVEGAGHQAHESYFKALVEFPQGANLDCKPEGTDGAQTVKSGCSPSKFYSTTISNQMIKERQYIEPGAKIAFKDETRFDQDRKGWKGQDGNFY